MSFADMRDFFSSFDSIRYNGKDELIEFDFNYDNFTGGSMSCRKLWTVCTYGERLESYINPDKNNSRDERTIILIDMFKQLFSQYGISLDDNLKESILAQTDKQFFVQLSRLFKLTVQLRNSKSKDTEIDYIISPVRDENGEFFDSRCFMDCEGTSKLPHNADANGAYNIARKALYAIDVIKATDDRDLDRAMIYPKNKEWLEYVQK